MKSALGCLQLILWGGGIVALFNAQWIAMIACWVAAALVGFAGNQMVRLAQGVSQSGQDAIGNVNRSVTLLERGEYESAVGATRALVSGFRSGGDKQLLPLALTFHSVALGAARDVPGARRALDEAARGLRMMPREFADEVAELRHVHQTIERELDRGVPDPSRLVAEFLAWND